MRRQQQLQQKQQEEAAKRKEEARRQEELRRQQQQQQEEERKKQEEERRRCGTLHYSDLTSTMSDYTKIHGLGMGEAKNFTHDGQEWKRLLIHHAGCFPDVKRKRKQGSRHRFRRR